MRQDDLVSSNAAPPSVVDEAAQPAAESTTALDAPGDAPDAAPAEEVGSRSPAALVELDPGAIDMAKAAAVAEAGIADHVGDFVAAIADDDVAVTATFVARQAGYSGWHWSVTLAVLDPGSATVSEVVLLPGEGALLAPAWIPWDQRIRPGDVGVGDLLPPIENDPRLVPAYLQSDDPAVEAVARELGVGRVHVLSREGREDFAERLHDGTFGPTGEIALAAPAHCFGCAFYLPLAGSLGQLIGACGNEYSPADGRVVDADFGCGAHSETVIEMPARSAASLAVIDELSLEVHRHPVPADVAETIAEPETAEPEVAYPETAEPAVDEREAVDGDEAVDEPAVDEDQALDAEVDELNQVEVVDPDVNDAVEEAAIHEVEAVDEEAAVEEIEVVEADLLEAVAASGGSDSSVDSGDSPVDGSDSPVVDGSDSTSGD